MTRFIDEERTAHGVEPICKVLPIAPSTCHAHAARQADPTKAPPRTQRDGELGELRVAHGPFPRRSYQAERDGPRKRRTG